ncbi:hypothetical protein SAMN02910340_01522 [Methanosarcina thermophila]|uniref:Uncharacterized protein n=1 Tax=Methanosarcina thermophila TaxID=2210 RepID=A0A1I6ZJA2_METTE|nr:hypothetical protein [Methanosarcina thermophila]ALK04913.1 MAG: hypothetical protein AAY43_03390 [Methanosarcina sp. 795]NLU58026.1 hypothetical protein [Methanosarcina thermophila]SFT62750.1 hypothetical protein SAMN02910340_01522 [Methanosarcina thermophila]BAW28643.1 conserved hypothetical protein [Methanosarcina thermophila]GLI13918.1 hypothetical protein MTHERMMSTA1_10440 [Methanosarcina thermophila MST-A1]
MNKKENPGKLFKNTIDLEVEIDLGVESMTHHNEEKKAEPKEEEAKVEPIHPSESRGGKKRGLLDTCK